MQKMSNVIFFYCNIASIKKLQSSDPPKTWLSACLGDFRASEELFKNRLFQFSVFKGFTVLM